MPVLISMLRGVNVGGHNRIKMEALRAVYTALGLRDPQTYVQSGNVIFRTDTSDTAELTRRIRDGIEQGFGFRPEVVLRTAAELRSAIANNPFPARNNFDPSRFLVYFLASDPGAAASAKVRALKTDPEEIRIAGRELYIYFPEGMARPKLSWAALEKALGVPGTGRNWTSVTKMLAMAEALEQQC